MFKNDEEETDLVCECCEGSGVIEVDIDDEDGVEVVCCDACGGCGYEK